MDPVRRPIIAPQCRKALQKQTFSVVGETGFEPATARPPAGCATRLRHSPWLSRKRATGIEPALEAWKASVQPQHFARSGRPDDSREVRPRLGADNASELSVRRAGAALLGGHLAARAGQRGGRPGAEPVVARAVQRDDGA